jgi:hypothetical protein
MDAAAGHAQAGRGPVLERAGSAKAGQIDGGAQVRPGVQQPVRLPRGLAERVPRGRLSNRMSLRMNERRVLAGLLLAGAHRDTRRIP